LYTKKKKLITAACLYPKFKLVNGKQKNIAANFLSEDLLEIKSSKNSPNDKQQATGLTDDFLWRKKIARIFQKIK